MALAPRWRVVIVDDHERSRRALRAAVGAGGGAVLGEAGRAAGALDLVRRLGPDVVVAAVGLPDGDGVGLARDVASQAGCPVVLVASRLSEDVSRRALAAGVMAFLFKPLRAAELAPTLDLAVARFAEAAALRRELAGRKLVERAKGLLMARAGLTEAEAFRRLRRASMDHRRPLAEVARAVLVSESLGPAMPPPEAAAGPPPA